jgi:ABC-type Na+ efflux pump permease subunit
MAASVIAADSFVGEKERKTLEALLYTPTSDAELYVGKVMAPWIAALIVSLFGFVGYSIVVNVIGAPIVGQIFFPNLMWMILALWVAPAAAGLGLASMVLVSSRMNTFQEAYQVGGLIVLPIVLLILGQIFGIIFFSEGFVLLIGLVLWIIDGALLWIGARQFARGELLARL